MFDLYYFQLVTLFSLSALLLVLSIRKKKTIGLVEFFILGAWFYVFLRPFAFADCKSQINFSLYFWDLDGYIFGTIFSFYSIVILQIGAFISIRKNKIRYQEREVSNSIYYQFLTFNFLLFIFLVFFLYMMYGSLLFPWNRISLGASSNALPGFQFVWPLINILSFFIIVLSLNNYIHTKQRRYIFVFLLFILIILVLGRRGIIIRPIFFFAFVYLFFVFFIMKKNIFYILNFNNILLLLVFFVVVFAGKGIISYIVVSHESNYFVKESSNFLCNIVDAGQQEFDLVWPIIVLHSGEWGGVIDFFFAIVGNLFPHQDRLLNYPELYSITDKIMMNSYLKDAYLYDKFGISPNVFQFWFSYLNVFSVFVFFIIGIVSQKIEFFTLRFFYSNKILSFYMAYLLFSFVFSPIDFSMKYYIVQVVYFLLVLFLFRLYVFLINELSKRSNLARVRRVIPPKNRA